MADDRPAPPAIPDDEADAIPLVGEGMVELRLLCPAALLASAEAEAGRRGVSVARLIRDLLRGTAAAPAAGVDGA